MSGDHIRDYNLLRIKLLRLISTLWRKCVNDFV